MTIRTTTTAATITPGGRLFFIHWPPSDHDTTRSTDVRRAAHRAVYDGRSASARRGCVRATGGPPLRPYAQTAVGRWSKTTIPASSAPHRRSRRRRSLQEHECRAYAEQLSTTVQ